LRRREGGREGGRGEKYISIWWRRRDEKREEKVRGSCRRDAQSR